MPCDCDLIFCWVRSGKHESDRGQAAKKNRAPRGACWRGRARLCRAAAGRGARHGGVHAYRHRPRRPEGRGHQPRGGPTSRTSRPRPSRHLRDAGKLDATTDFAVVTELDTINICVPTPLRKTKDPDMSYIVSAVEAIAKHLHPGMLIVPRVDDLSRHDRRSRAAAARSDRAQGRRRLLHRVLARTGRSRQPDVPHAQCAEGGRRADAGLRDARGARSTAPRSRRSSRSARRGSPRWSSCSRTRSAR